MGLQIKLGLDPSKGRDAMTGDYSAFIRLGHEGLKPDKKIVGTAALGIRTTEDQTRFIKRITGAHANHKPLCGTRRLR